MKRVWPIIFDLTAMACFVAFWFVDGDQARSFAVLFGIICSLRADVMRVRNEIDARRAA
jgi:hypothetical protein